MHKADVQADGQAEELRHSAEFGLYRPTEEHDACGVGFVAHIKGTKAHGIVEVEVQNDGKVYDRKGINLPKSKLSIPTVPQEDLDNLKALINDAARRVVELGWLQPGQRVGITAGLPSGRPGSTSLLQIQQL